jgi:hypothetical protein
MTDVSMYVNSRTGVSLQMDPREGAQCVKNCICRLVD